MSGPEVQVNDWAYNPTDMLLYGGDRLNSKLITLNPLTGALTVIDVAGLLANNVAFGAAWYDPTIGHVFLYNNGGTIFQIDPGTKMLVGAARTAPEVTRNDATFVPMVVAEPGTLALFGLGLAGLGLARRKRMT